MDKLELRLSLYKGERGYWPDPPSNAAQLNPTCEGTSSPQETPRKLYAPRRNDPGCSLYAHLIRKLTLAHATTLFRWDLFSGFKVYGAKLWYVWARRVTIRVILLWFCRGWHTDTGRGSHSRGLVTVHGCALGCRMWSVAGDILFDQLSRGFRKRRGKCALAKWTYSTWRAYRSVFTCLLSQVVQTARLPFHSDSGQYADCFCRAGRVNGTNTGKCLQSSKLAQDTFRLNLCKIICKKQSVKIRRAFCPS